MSTISLRLPDSLHRQVRKLAEKENVSINQLITLALTEKMSALLTEEYLEERAKRGNRKRFQRAMAKVPKVTPEEYDRLPQR
jgi:predicted transcriptional regulator